MTTASTASRVSSWVRLSASFGLAGGIAQVRLKGGKTLEVLVHLLNALHESASDAFDGTVGELSSENLGAESFGVTATEWAKGLKELEAVGLISRRTETIAFQDPETGSWPPLRFAMVPAPFLRDSLERVRTLSGSVGLELESVLAVYFSLVVQRDFRTGQIWFSKTRMPELSSVELPSVVKAVKVLKDAAVISRSRTALWVITLNGFAPMKIRRPSTDP